MTFVDEPPVSNQDQEDQPADLLAEVTADAQALLEQLEAVVAEAVPASESDNSSGDDELREAITSYFADDEPDGQSVSFPEGSSGVALSVRSGSTSGSWSGSRMTIKIRNFFDVDSNSSDSSDSAESSSNE